MASISALKLGARAQNLSGDWLRRLGPKERPSEAQSKDEGKSRPALRKRGPLTCAHPHSHRSFLTVPKPCTGRLPELVTQRRESSGRRDVTLGEACTEALRDKAPDISGSTLERYSQGIAHFLDFADAKTLARDALTKGVMQRFKGARLDAGAAQQTVNNDVSAVSIVATYSLSQGWISERPRVKRFKHAARIRWLEKDQLATYMAALRRRFRTQQMLLVGTGMRLGESENLRVCDVQLTDGTSHAMVEQAKTTNGVRTVFLPQWVAEALTAYIEEHNLQGTDLLFTIQRREVQKEHNRACKLAGLHSYTIHDHRHTCAVHLARVGMPLNLVQQQLGHEHIEMTMKYARFHPNYSDVAGFFEAVSTSLGLGTANNTPNNTPVSG